jgi:hypothetical protein
MVDIGPFVAAAIVLNLLSFPRFDDVQSKAGLL